MTIWTDLPDLARRDLGGAVVWANDEAFAARQNLITPGRRCSTRPRSAFTCWSRLTSGASSRFQDAVGAVRTMSSTALKPIQKFRPAKTMTSAYHFRERGRVNGSAASSTTPANSIGSRETFEPIWRGPGAAAGNGASTPTPDSGENQGKLAATLSTQQDPREGARPADQNPAKASV